MRTVSHIKKILNLIIGILLVSISFNMFLSPNDLAAGGISGLALIYSKLYNIDLSVFVLIANIILIIVSYIFLGKEQTRRTILGSLLLPLFLNLTKDLPNLIKIDEVDILLKALFGGVISGYGYGIVFKHGFTSGGTDIVDQLVSKWYHISMSTSILLVDGFIVICGGVVFGAEKMIYSAIVLILISIYSNKSMIGTNDYKTFYITTKKTKTIIKLLQEKFGYSVTTLDAVGGYSKKARKILMCVVKTSDYYEIEETLKYIDPNIFITITTSYETINHQKEQ